MYCNLVFPSFYPIEQSVPYARPIQTVPARMGRRILRCIVWACTVCWNLSAEKNLLWNCSSRLLEQGDHQVEHKHVQTMPTPKGRHITQRLASGPSMLDKPRCWKNWYTLLVWAEQPTIGTYTCTDKVGPDGAPHNVAPGLGLHLFLNFFKKKTKKHRCWKGCL